MTDNEIIKAFEVCIGLYDTEYCPKCPYKDDDNCNFNLNKDALDLINRLKAENKNCGVKIQNQREQLKACNEKIKEQQAEIEGLTTENERLNGKVEELSLVLSDTIKIRYKEAKSEAVKEFAERLKRRFDRFQVAMYSEGTVVETIDNLLKEMG